MLASAHQENGNKKIMEQDEDTTKCDKTVKCFTMDEAFLNDLLECSVCLEQLDTTSKVLPCQHTFCKRCLEEIVNSRKELRCPECRILVETRIDDLPCNILLIRLLEGIKNNVKPKRISSTEAGDIAGKGPETFVNQIQQAPQHPLLPNLPGLHPNVLGAGDLRTVPKQVLQPCPCAKALYSYEGKVPGDLTFKKGDIIILRKRVDQNWYYGELSGKGGFVPASFVQVVVPLPTYIPQCRALYDFHISNSEEEDCLTFSKGEIMTVIRRVDDHWAEGKLGDRIGIFPISFVEMNAAARALVKLSTSTQQGPSKILPPAPTTESLFVTNQQGPAVNVSSNHLTMGQDAISGSPSSQAVPCSAISPFTSSIFTSPVHTVPLLITQSQSSGLPHFSGFSQERQPGPQVFSHPVSQLASHHRERHFIPVSQPPPLIASPASGSVNLSGDGNEGTIVENPSVTVRSSRTSPGPVFAQTSPNILTTPPTVSQRAESIVSVPVQQQSINQDLSLNQAPSHQGPDVTAPCHTPTRTVGPINHPPTHVPVPTFYLALYSYRPQKEDELELRKGELYTVSEKCQDGWFKGTSLRTGLSGVFPGNYVQVAKSAVLHPHLMASPGAQTSPSTSPPPNSSASPQTRPGVISSEAGVLYTISQSAPSSGVFTPTTLSTRSQISPSTGNVQLNTVSVSHQAVSEWAESVAAFTPLQRLPRPGSTVGLSPVPYRPETSPKQNGYIGGQARSPGLSPWSGSWTVSFTSSSSPVVTDFPVRNAGKSSPTRMFSYPTLSNVSTGCPQVMSQGVSSGSIVDTTTHLRYSNSQPVTPSVVPHTLPVATVAAQYSTPAGPSSSPSCASSSSSSAQVRIDKHKEKKEKEILSLMKRLTKRKSKSPPPSDYSCDNPTFIDAPTSSGQSSLSTVHVRSTSCPSEAPGGQSVSHKKTGSLDGSAADVPKSSSRPKQPAPLVRERFRCIVPYPPNSDYELELRVGDIVYVHKKRDDGWYKGTLQRTGKTGLFPSSFVESF